MFSKDCFFLLVRATTTIKKEDLSKTTTVRNFISYEKSWHKNGRKFVERTWKNGLEEGLEQHWYENGQKFAERTWKNGKLDGLEQHWYKNGQKWIEINWKNGKRDGLERCWRENEQKYIERIWKNGVEIEQLMGEKEEL